MMGLKGAEKSDDNIFSHFDKADECERWTEHPQHISHSHSIAK